MVLTLYLEILYSDQRNSHGNPLYSVAEISKTTLKFTKLRFFHPGCFDNCLQKWGTICTFYTHLSATQEDVMSPDLEIVSHSVKLSVICALL